MARIDNLKGSKGTQFGSGQDTTKGGRKKKIYNVLKDVGYSKDDIGTCFGEMAFYTIDEIEEVVQDSKKPVIMKVVAMAFKNAAQKGEWKYIKEIMEHTMGRPLPKVEVVEEVVQEKTYDYSYLSFEEKKTLLNLTRKARQSAR